MKADHRPRRPRAGRNAVPIRLSNPSACKSSGLVDSILPTDSRPAYWFEGVLQREALTILQTEGNVAWIREDAPGFRWTDGKSWHDYRPTLVAGRPNGDKDIVEIQWAALAEKLGTARLIEKYVQPFALKVGYSSVSLWTDVEIRDPVRIANAALLHSTAKDRPDTRLVDRLLGCLRDAPEGQRVVDLLGRAGTGTQAFRTVAHLVWRGDVEIWPAGALISPKAIVRPGSKPRGTAA